MQELQLISTGKVMAGGTTQPFTALALNENGNVEEYIVKAFTKKQLLQNASVAKEIIVCELAKMFDLTIPEYGIMNCALQDLQGVYKDERIDTLDLGAKFCSKFMSQYPIFTNVTSNIFLKDYEILNIFAFDVFIFNVDRGGYRNKPNLLINDNELMIIDHELTFPFINNNYRQIDYEQNLSSYQYSKHVLIKYIKSLNFKDRVFNEFLFNLNSLNINRLDLIFDKLEYYNIHFFDRENFMNYFVWAKNNVSIFERYLTLMTR
ncbi:hypothetical protein EV144_1011350 [Flavobacterium sp. 270]|uniref:HipA family kinase n=1 Tax=Flavobacterium sp. 270 TaxID=2512114 RepID=UPI001065C901|nr:HipA family kinase [Flavobacterium sp. 270]TDW52659.1 hypothetical protein EV144_1011350 [Flavobacterium sp. 270]